MEKSLFKVRRASLLWPGRPFLITSFKMCGGMIVHRVSVHNWCDAMGWSSWWNGDALDHDLGITHATRILRASAEVCAELQTSRELRAQATSACATQPTAMSLPRRWATSWRSSHEASGRDC